MIAPRAPLLQLVVFRLAPPVLLMAFIFWIGTERASAELTRGLLDRLIAQLFPALHARLTPDQLMRLNMAVRKTGHFTGYALLGILDARALRGLRERRGGLPERTLGLGAGAWLGAAVWASVDEYHQSFSPSRGASVWDVALDSAGAAAGILLYSLWTSRRLRSA